MTNRVDKELMAKEDVLTLLNTQTVNNQTVREAFLSLAEDYLPSYEGLRLIGKILKEELDLKADEIEQRQAMAVAKMIMESVSTPNNDTGLDEV